MKQHIVAIGTVAPVLLMVNVRMKNTITKKKPVVSISKTGVEVLEKDSICIDAIKGCGSGYKDLGGWCNRVRYTPAEAAAILKDNENTVTITFRK